MPKGLPAAGGEESCRALTTLSPSISRAISSPLGQNLCLGAQAQTRSLAGVCSPWERGISAEEKGDLSPAGFSTKPAMSQ